jgi:hypothetical protein
MGDYYKDDDIPEDDKRNTAFQTTNAIREAVSLALKKQQQITYEQAMVERAKKLLIGNKWFMLSPVVPMGKTYHFLNSNSVHVGKDLYNYEIDESMIIKFKSTMNNIGDFDIRLGAISLGYLLFVIHDKRHGDFCEILRRV